MHSLCKAFCFMWRAYWSTLEAGSHLQFGKMLQHTLQLLHTLSDILSLSPPLNIILVASGIGSVSYWEGQNRHTHIRTHHTHTHTHSHRFQISPSGLRGWDCFTGNHVMGQMIELLMEARCNNNRALSIVIPTCYSQAPFSLT